MTDIWLQSRMPAALARRSLRLPHSSMPLQRRSMSISQEPGRLGASIYSGRSQFRRNRSRGHWFRRPFGRTLRHAYLQPRPSRWNRTLISRSQRKSWNMPRPPESPKKEPGGRRRRVNPSSSRFHRPNPCLCRTRSRRTKPRFAGRSDSQLPDRPKLPRIRTRQSRAQMRHPGQPNRRRRPPLRLVCHRRRSGL